VQDHPDRRATARSLYTLGFDERTGFGRVPVLRRAGDHHVRAPALIAAALPSAFALPR
jgi:hypothetical protein